MSRRPVADFVQRGYVFGADHHVRAIPLRHSLAVVFLSALTLVPLPAGAATGHAVSFRSADGRTVNGLMFEADLRPAPGVVLVPMLGRPKEDWQALGQRLSEANITALAIDFPASSVPDNPRIALGWATDVRAAVDFLVSRPETRSGTVAVAGASLGATIAAIEAAGDSRVRALALLSPTLEYRGVHLESPMRQYGARPVLLASSSHDSYSARSARELAKDAPGPREVQVSDTAGHGTVLLSRDPDLARMLVEWFRRILG